MLVCRSEQRVKTTSYPEVPPRRRASRAVEASSAELEAPEHHCQDRLRGPRARRGQSHRRAAARAVPSRSVDPVGGATPARRRSTATARRKLLVQALQRGHRPECAAPELREPEDAAVRARPTRSETRSRSGDRGPISARRELATAPVTGSRGSTSGSTRPRAPRNPVDRGAACRPRRRRDEPKAARARERGRRRRPRRFRGRGRSRGAPRRRWRRPGGRRRRAGRRRRRAARRRRPKAAPNGQAWEAAPRGCQRCDADLLDRLKRMTTRRLDNCATTRKWHHYF